MKEKILELLKNSDDFISGQTICEKLGVSRTAVWKNINTLKKEGYEIDAVNNKGYKLVREPDIVTEEKIRAALHTREFGRTLYYYDEIDSTNIQAKIAGEGEEVHGALFVANEQVAGRGRRGRSWSTPKGTSIAMTFLLRPNVPIENVSRLTILSALAIVRALRETAGLHAEIKWPNDVVVNGRKICGILTEMSSEGMDIKYAVVGIGINVAMTEFPEELADKATSIKLENGIECSRSKLVANIANDFEQLYDAFTQHEDLQFIMKEYDEALVNRNQQVYVIEGDRRMEYTALGLAPNGGLRVRDADGQESVIISGEVSVRGIYGYV